MRKCPKEAFREAKKYHSRGELAKKNHSCYKFLLRHNLLDKACKHMPPPRLLWDKKTAIKEAKKYTRLIDLINKNPGCYNWLRKNGAFLEATSHMTPERIDWTRKRAFKEAKNYRTRLEMHLQNSGCYKFLKRNNYLDAACKHMKNKFKWNRETAFNEAKKHQNIQDFRRQASGCVYWLRVNRLMAQACKHMKKQINLKENKFRDQVVKQLSKQYPDFILEVEKTIPQRDNKKGRVDLIVKNPLTSKFIVLELKHSEAWWTPAQIRSQLAKYKRAFRERKGFQGVYLLSNDGKYGQNITELKSIIRKTLTHPKSLKKLLTI